MMGNFLTTLGSEPEDDRAMFEELGLNVARQPDNGANPRPDNRSGLARGRDARATPVDELIDSQAEANFWNPDVQLRRVKKDKVPPRARRRAQPRACEVVQVEGEAPMTDIEQRARGDPATGACYAGCG